MASADEVLADNLREALGGVQKMLLLGTGAAIVYMLLAMQPPGGPDSAGAGFARMLALMVALVAGAMAAVTAQQACRIEVHLRRNTALHNAVVTFPSVATLQDPAPRLFFAVAPGVMLAGGTYLVYVDAGDVVSWALVALVALPYVVLGLRLRRPLRRVSLAGV